VTDGERHSAAVEEAVVAAGVARRATGRVAAGLLAAVAAGSSALVGAGTAYAQAHEVQCLTGPTLPAAVTLTEGERVQLVLVVPLLGTRVAVGPAQTAGLGDQVLSATVTELVGLAGQVCRAAVVVEAAARSVAPLPPLPVPPAVPLPPQSERLTLPGVEVSVETGGVPTGGDPGTGQPGGAPPGGPAPSVPGSGAGGGGAPAFRFLPGRVALHDLSALPGGLADRFGGGLVPAFRFGQRVPGYAPELGLLDRGSDDTGRVRPVAVEDRPAVALPVLVAVLVVAMVTGVVVRRWSLRRG
jgi:hypothetical protein